MTKTQIIKEPPDRQKAVLFCPECDHEGDLNSDWIIESTGTTETITCPNCSSVVLKNPKKQRLYC